METPTTKAVTDAKFKKVNAVLSGVCILLGVLIVLAVVFPVRHTGENAGRAHALSQVKQIGTALAMYAADHNDHLPVASRWMDQLKPYIKSDDILRSDLATPEDQSDYGFAFRAEFSQKKVASFEVPAQQVVIFDSTLLTRNAHSGLESLPKPGRYDGGKEKGNIFGFIDGHAKFVADSKLKDLAPNGKPVVK